MFKIDEAPAFWTPVKVRLGDEPEHTFRARFKVRPISEWEKTDREDPDMVKNFLTESLLDWADIEAGEEQPLAFNAKNRDRLIDFPHVRLALFRAYSAGVAGAREGN